jgi:hypothetical protein
MVGLLLLAGLSGSVAPARAVFAGGASQNLQGVGLQIVRFPPPLVINSVVANATTVDVTMGFNVTVNASGGSGNPANYNYTWHGLPAACPDSYSAVQNCTPTVAGRLSITVTVNDTLTLQSNTSGAVNITVNSLPTLTKFNVSKTNITQGTEIWFNATGSGGTAPLSFVYAGLPRGCTGNTSSFSCAPTLAGTYNVTVVAMDSLGMTSNKLNVQVTVQGNKSTTTVTPGIGNSGWAIVGGILVIGALATVALLWQARREDRAGQTATVVATQVPPDQPGGSPPSGPMPPAGPSS